MTKIMQTNVAPFPVESLGHGRYSARLEDISAYLKAWSSGAHLYVDARYVTPWLLRMGLPCDPETIETYTNDEYEYIVEWEKSCEDFVPVAYEDAWLEEGGEQV